MDKPHSHIPQPTKLTYEGPTYEGLGFEPRRYAKSELARILDIHPNTLRKELLAIQEELGKIAPYSKFQKLLSPLHVRFYLGYYGYLEVG